MRFFIIITILLFFSCNQNYVYGADIPTPVINYDNNQDDLRVFGDFQSALNQESEMYNFAVFGNFSRMLNKTEHEIIEKYKLYQEKEFINMNEYKIIKISTSDAYEEIVSLYIVNSNGTCVGYLLLEPIISFSNNNLISIDPIFEQISSLPLFTPTYLDNVIIPPTYLTGFYGTEHNNYVEIYGYAKLTKIESIVLEGFYPKVLEENLSSYIIETLNFNFENLIKYNDFLKL